MRIVLPGGSGHVGAVLRRAFDARGWTTVVLSRRPQGGEILWDGESVGPWAEALDGADAVINLAGRTVDCRYTPEHLREMMDSRVLSTRAVGEAIRAAANPPRVWLQASTATIYAHRFDAPNDEATGLLGGDEPGAPPKWNASIAVAKAWEAALDAAETPRTRKVALRSAIAMSPDRESAFDVLATLARRGLGGPAGNGRQYVSWIHEADFVAAVLFLLERDDLAGPINVCAPNPLPNRDFACALRRAVGAPFGLPAAPWMLEIGARLLGTETELILKSRRVVPARLLEAGFAFRFPDWPEAARDLARRKS